LPAAPSPLSLHDALPISSRIAHATLHDVVAPQPPPGAPFQVRSVASDLSLEGEADKLVAERPGVIFHLAAVVSGEAEADFEKGRSEEHTSELQSRGHLVC